MDWAVSARDWVAAGFDYAALWDLAPSEVALHMAAARRRSEADIASRRVLQQELVHLVAYAFHRPADIPDLTEKQRRGPADPEAAKTYAANKARAAALNYRVALAAQSRR